MPVSAPSRVDLPAPLGPMIAEQAALAEREADVVEQDLAAGQGDGQVAGDAARRPRCRRTPAARCRTGGTWTGPMPTMSPSVSGADADLLAVDEGPVVAAQVDDLVRRWRPGAARRGSGRRSGRRRRCRCPGRGRSAAPWSAAGGSRWARGATARLTWPPPVMAGRPPPRQAHPSRPRPLAGMTGLDRENGGGAARDAPVEQVISGPSAGCPSRTVVSPSRMTLDLLLTPRRCRWCCRCPPGPRNPCRA